MFKKRNPLVVLVLLLITFGIYSIYWIVTTQNAIKSRFGVGCSGGVTIVLMFITFGIYGIIWNYRLGTVCEKLGGQDNGVLFLVLSIIGVGGLANPVIAQGVINNSVDRMDADGAM